MKGFTSKPYNSCLSLVKALTVESEAVIVGHYSQVKDPNSDSAIHYVKEPADADFYEVNPYTICRNSGIKDKNGSFVFEYDLLKIKTAFEEAYGFLIWEDAYKAWKIRQFTEYGGCSDVSKYQIEVIGNIVLSASDAEVIYKQDEAERERKIFIDNSYCPSKFKK